MRARASSAFIALLPRANGSDPADGPARRKGAMRACVRWCSSHRARVGFTVTCNGVTDVRKRGVVEPSYLPTGRQQSRPGAPTYLPTAPVLRVGELGNVKKDQTQLCWFFGLECSTCTCTCKNPQNHHTLTVTVTVTNTSQATGTPRFVPHVVRAEWAWILTSRAAATVALVVC